MSSYTFASPAATDHGLHNTNTAYPYDSKAFQGLQGLAKASFSVNHILDLEELPRNHGGMFAHAPNVDTTSPPHGDLGMGMVGAGQNNSCIHISPSHTDEPQKSPMGKSNRILLYHHH